MGPGGELGDDPAAPRVERDLARDGLGDDASRPVEEGHPRLVAGGLDREQEAAQASPSPGSAVISGSAAISARRATMRAAIAGSARGAVVMIRASSWSSL